MSKYIFKQSSADFILYAENKDEHVSSHGSLGTFNFSRTNTIYGDIKLTAFINGELVFSHLEEDLNYFNLNIPILIDGVKTVCDKVFLEISIKNPLVITAFLGCYTGGYSVISSLGLGKMINLNAFSGYGYFPTTTPENLFDLKALTSLLWAADDILTLSNKFVQGGLVNLETLNLKVSYYSQGNNENNIKLLPNLKTLVLEDRVVDVVDSMNFQWDENFVYPITNLTYFQRFGSVINAIPSKVCNMRSIECFKVVISNVDFDFTYPLLNGLDNTVLKELGFQINVSWSSKIFLPRNIMNLKALESVQLGRSNRNSTIDADAELDWFYEYFYKNIYNEKDNSKGGYVHSSVAFIGSDLAGFKHDTFRAINFTGNEVYAAKNSLAKQPLVTEMNLTGFTFTTFYI